MTSAEEKKMALKFVLVGIYFSACQSQEPVTILTSSETPTVPVTTTPPLTPTTIESTSKKGSKIKQDLVDWLVANITDRNVEYEGYDGWYNNPSDPSLGSVDSPLIRFLKPEYSDGSYQPTKRTSNPLEISDKVMAGPSGSRSKTGKTALLVFFGQQVVEEILDAQRPGCPPEYFSIEIPKGSQYSDLKRKELPVLRSRYDTRTGSSPNNPRQQLNEITPWIDGGLVYGTSKAWSDTLRSFKDGMLSSSNGSLYPEENTIGIPMANPPPPIFHPELKSVKRFFKLGNPRGNENPYLLTFGILWFRWHNVIAATLRKQPAASGWSDERLFNEARKWVIATYQHLVINKWLSEWMEDSLPPYSGYNSSINPGISLMFQSAAMRFGHTLVVSGIYPRSPGEECKRITDSVSSSGHRMIRTCNSYWNPRTHVENYGLEGMLLGLASQSAEREDNIVVEDLRGQLFGPLEFNRRDLVAINIQRGRDHGLPSYRTAREYFFPDETPITTFSEMKTLSGDVSNKEEMYSTILPKLYKNNTGDVDIWVGGLLETKTSPGSLFKAIILDQFRRIRDGDRFWFENTKNGLFTPEEIERIKELTIYDVILAVTDISVKDIQKNPFRLPTQQTIGTLHENCRQTMTSSYSCDDPDESTTTCYAFPPVSSGVGENCTSPKTFDYFTGSEVSYALTFLSLFLFIVGCIVVLLLLVRRRRRQIRAQRQRVSKHRRQTLDVHSTVAAEWVGQKEGIRAVVLRFLPEKKHIAVHQLDGKIMRSMDISRVQSVELQVSANAKRDYLLIRISREYDLILKFDSSEDRQIFIKNLEEFLGTIGVGRQRREMNLQDILKEATTKGVRQKQLEKFFRVVFAQAFGINHDQKELLNLDADEARQIINIELTPYEFAESLSLRPDAVFVKQMFDLVDKDRNGFINFREFLDMIVLFAKGTAEDKAKLMFDMYDFDHSGKLTRDEFSSMIRSLTELANQSLSQESLDALVDNMFKSDGLKNKEALTFEDFTRLMSDHRSELGYAHLSFDMAGMPISMQPSNFRQSASYRAHESIIGAYSAMDKDQPGGEGVKETCVQVEAKQDVYQTNKTKKEVTRLMSFIENNQLQVFWATLYTFVLFGIFIERAYYYSVEREHGGLRRIAGYGVTVTRGAASCMMFTFSTMLLTVCRNTVTFLRETFLYRFFPFDDALALHKFIAFWGLVFSVIHSVGHALNFYHISTQTSQDLACLFRDFFRATDALPKFHYWCFGTITGLTGVLLVMVMTVIYVFAVPYARRYVCSAFWTTHNLYPLFFLLMVLHGLGRLVQDPIFYYFFLGPCVLYTIDKLVTISRKKKEISVVRAKLLPSDVTMLELKKPPNFEYRSGQWVRIACPTLSSNEYHPFTLSSAPHEETLTLHIRAVGPWTTNLRQLYNPDTILQHALPKVFLDGPYGEGHQDWFRYDVAILIGGGIGVTPFSSILKDLVFKTSLRMKMTCKKVYFLWVTRTQKQFEWMTDLIQDIETKDSKNMVVVHIFITQFYQKFDLRTTMLYICERHFQRVCNRSLFTGLRSTTHFGRPNFNSFLNSLQNEHPEVEKFGVFSCGPPPMTRNVQTACDTLNKHDGAIFTHHYENF